MVFGSSAAVLSRQRTLGSVDSLRAIGRVVVVLVVEVVDLELLLVLTMASHIGHFCVGPQREAGGPIRLAQVSTMSTIRGQRAPPLSCLESKLTQIMF